VSPISFRIVDINLEYMSAAAFTMPQDRELRY